MIYAYDDYYLTDAMNNLGEAFDYAANVCKIDLEMFAKIFANSELASSFEIGNPSIVSGCSGTELAIEILRKSNFKENYPTSQVDYSFSQEYWCGYVLAYYQFITAKSFENILSYVSIEEIIKLYPTLHEASEDKFVDTLNQIINMRTNLTKLQQQRKICGYTQNELCIKAGVNLRTLQQYETRAKNLNNASISTVITLAKVLGCHVTDLLE